MPIFFRALIERISFIAIVLVPFWSPSASHAQVPGDGLPDIYYFGFDGQIANTSVGQLSRPVGTVLFDTDGEDVVALLIEGPDLISGLPDDGSYLFGSTASLPGPQPLFESHWTTGYINHRSQWIRTNLLDSEGFVGVIGEHPDDPFSIFPNLGLARLPGLPTFDYGTVTMATNSGTVFEFEFCQQVFCVPEPTGLCLLLPTLMAFRCRCHRSARTDCRRWHSGPLSLARTRNGLYDEFRFGSKRKRDYPA